MVKETKEVVVAPSTEVAAPISQEAWGDTPMSKNDLIIPKVVLMQPGSTLVVDGLAKFGDFLNTTTKEVVGNMVEGLQIVPFFLHKLWHIMAKNDKGDFEFSHIQKIETLADENLPWDDMEEGTPIKRVFVRQFYCIIPKLGMFPVAISFKSTSARAGKELATQMYVINKSMGRSPAGTMVKLFGIKQKNDKGLTYGALSTTPLCAADPAVEKEAFNWFQILKTQEVKVAEDIEEVSTGTQQNLAF